MLDEGGEGPGVPVVATIEHPVGEVIDEQVELAQIRDLRQELGLPERSPLFYDPPSETEASTVLDGFYQRRLNRVLTRRGGGFIDRNRIIAEEQKREKGREAQPAVVRIFERVKIPRVTDYVACLSQRGLIGNDPRDYGSAVYLMTLGLSPEQLAIALDRMALFGIRITKAGDIRTAIAIDRKFRDALNLFATKDEAEFQAVCQQLNQYYFLGSEWLPTSDLVQVDTVNQGKKQKKMRRLNDDVYSFAAIVENNGLTPEQKTHFDVKLKQNLLEVSPIKSRFFQVEVERADCGARERQKLEVTEKLLYQWLVRQEAVEDDIRFENRFFAGMDRHYDQLKSFTDNSIHVPFAVCQPMGAPYYKPIKAERPEDQIDQFRQSEVARQWTVLFNELLGDNFTLYADSLFQNRRALADLAVVMHALPTDVHIGFQDVVKVGVGLSPDVVTAPNKELIIDTSGLLNAMLNGVDLSRSQMSAEDKAYHESLRIFFEIENGRYQIDTMHFPTLAYLARHKSEVAKCVKGRNVSEPLIEAIANGEIKLSDDALRFVFKNYFSNNNWFQNHLALGPDIYFRYQQYIYPYNLQRMIMSDSVTPEVITASSYLTDEDREIYLAVKKMDSWVVGIAILENRERFREFIIDGKITPALCRAVVAKAQECSQDIRDDLSSVSELLTDEVLAGFPPEERRFWATVKKYESFGQVIIDDEAKFGSYFTFSDLGQQVEATIEETTSVKSPVIEVGTPTSIFCYEVAKEGDPTPILTDEVLVTFPSEERDFWSAIKGRDIAEIKRVTKAVSAGEITCITACRVAKSAAFANNRMQATRNYIYTHGNILIKDASDIPFLERLVGDFGVKADQIIRGYCDCLTAQSISTVDKDLVIDFTKDFRVLSPTILTGYKDARQAGHAEVYVAQLRSLAERITGSGQITDQERARPYYSDLMTHVYANNSGQWTNYEWNNSCSDRSADLAEFTVQPRYVIDLLSQSEIKVKEGATVDSDTIKEVQKPILQVAKEMEAIGHDKEKISDALQTDIDNVLIQIQQQGGLSDLDLSVVTTTEEKMFLIVADSIYGSRVIDPTVVKKLMITYEFATFEDISDYITGTTDRVARASNHDYALLCEVGAFYSDRIKEVNRRLVTAAYANPAVTSLMPAYFKRLAEARVASGRQEAINRLRVDKLGLSEGYIRQAGRILEKRNGKKYTLEQVKRIIRIYEGLTGHLESDKSISVNEETRAFYGQLRSQRERTLDAIKVVTGEAPDPKTVYLGEINLQQALDAEANIRDGVYDEEQFAQYTIQRFIDLFEDERTQIDGELVKFESSTGKQREVLHGYITKTKESAHARMVGGVCVAGDNPVRGVNNMWDMPNYFQLVLQDPDTLQCQGLVLLHHFTDGEGKRILSASFNPSSTYLYSVDEQALSGGLIAVLEQFAIDNQFDIITVSKNHAIRTNRTGGTFEKAINERIAEVDRTYQFNSSRVFSYTPNYELKEMDVIWGKAT